MTDELWTIEQVSAYLGIKPSSARGLLSRWGVARTTTGTSSAGRLCSLYPAADVREAAARRPGRGARTDLDA
ncbi:hypothetical protein [Streptomyces sp. SID11385]|uniref:hypothetical protein n=1 Tax=Streptomyces sp. SID11385 TaxID=2706031 RepID=UPI0019438B9A|nr:hypothetical protein [Streptomyces sp. SID11385]